MTPAAHRSSRLRRFAALLTSPLVPDDYLELINPLWTRDTLRARIEAVTAETADSATLTLRPGPRWAGHRAGQFARIGVDVDGVRHQRCYSISSAPERGDGCFTISVKAAGRVSEFLVKQARVGQYLELGAADGHFVWPELLQTPVLMIAGGSGLTPVMSLLRSAAAREQMPEVVLVAYARTPDELMFRAELEQMAERFPNLRLELIYTQRGGAHFSRAQLDRVCPDWQRRDTWACGPAGLLGAVEAEWKAVALSHRLTVERFRPMLAPANAGAAGGKITFALSARSADSAGGTAILDTAEAAGLSPAHGCRMGICHGCTAKLKCGQVRDLRTGEVHGEEGDPIQICVSAPAGDVEIEL